MNYDRMVIESVNNKLESALRELEELNKNEHKETLSAVCQKLKETIVNLDAIDNEKFA